MGTIPEVRSPGNLQSPKDPSDFGDPSEVIRTSDEKNIYPLYLPAQTFCGKN